MSDEFPENWGKVDGELYDPFGVAQLKADLEAAHECIKAIAENNPAAYKMTAQEYARKFLLDSNRAT